MSAIYPYTVWTPPPTTPRAPAPAPQADLPDGVLWQAQGPGPGAMAFVPREPMVAKDTGTDGAWTGAIACAPSAEAAEDAQAAARGGVAGRFRTLLVDPPWHYEPWSKNGSGRGPEKHYNTLATEDIYGLPVGTIAAPESTLLLWATVPMLPQALKTLECWGFSYRSAIVWGKMAKIGAPRIGLGYHARSCVELLVIGQRGNPGAPLPADRPYGMMFCPPGEHSRKPEFQYEVAENYPGPHIEIFSRPRDGMFPPREGWVFVGDAVDGLDIRDALAELIAAAPPAPEPEARDAAEAYE